MKKVLAFILIAVMAVSTIFVAAHADGETTTVTFTFADMFSETGAVTEIEKDGVKITFEGGSNTSNSPMYYDNGKAVRVYKNNEFTVSSESAISSIAFTFAAANYALEYGVDTGSFAVNDTAGTWTGSANSVKFTNPSTGQTRIVEMKVTLGSSGSQPEQPEQPEQPVLDTPEKIVKAAYALETGKALDGTYELTGKIISVDTAYNSRYGNITVTIVVEGLEDYPIQCFRLKNGEGVDGVDKLAENDTITVSGILKRYSDTVVEFDKDCLLLSFTKAETEPEQPEEPEQPVLDTPEKIVKAAYALETGKALEGTFQLTGTITVVNTPFSSRYNNVTVTIVVEGLEDYPIQCFRLKDGEGVAGVDKIGEKDIITVSGKLKRFSDTVVEFDADCLLLSFTIVEKEEEKLPETPEEILNALYALADGVTMKGTYTLTGKVTEITTAYNEEFHNITVVMVVEGFEDKPVTCFRLSGEGADKIAVGDKITVTGPLKNYKGTYEFNQGTLDEIEYGENHEADNPGNSDAAIIAIATVGVIALAATVVLSKKEH